MNRPAGQDVLNQARARNDLAAVLSATEHLAGQNPHDPEWQLRLAECRLHCSDVSAALDTLRAVEAAAGDDAAILQRVGAFWVQCERHRDADRVTGRVLRLRPDDPQAVYNAALSRLALGALDEAEALFTRVISLDPADFDAWLNRSTLRRQTPESNHVAALRKLLARVPEGHEGRVPLHYALAKELEDLGEYEASFTQLQAGASARRRRLRYEVADDEAAMARIAEAFPEPPTDGVKGHDSEQPVLVLGLPRTGTTLVDRILSSHSQVASLGEVHALPFALMHTVGPHRDREDLVRRSVNCDFALLGRRYAGALAGHGEDAPRLVDKTPFNLLYLGIVRRALPRVRVIHLRRDPVDACYAMYKTLFRTGYPFSYSLQDVGRFTIACHRLMDHWRTVMPGWFLDVDYEALVTDTGAQVRRMLDFLELPFEPACLSPHEQSTPVATASAAQVRQPIYRSSVQRWRSFERQLAPLADKLREAGLPVA